MGRELRLVPPNWEHPVSERPGGEDGYQPLYDQSIEEAWADWQREFFEFQGAEHDRVIATFGSNRYPKSEPYTAFCNWHGTPPDPQYHRPFWAKGTATWFQVYETVTEGTPVTPPFETKGELIAYLVEHGDFWDQKRRAEGRSSMNCDPWSQQQAERFVNGPGWAPSFIQDSSGFRSGVEALGDSSPATSKETGRE